MTGKSECRLCGAGALMPGYHYEICDVLKCGDCGFVQVEIPPDKKSSAFNYDQSYFSHGKYVNDTSNAYEQRRRIRWLSRNNVKQGAKILDAGCATGDFISAARDTFDIWGVDVSEHAINTAKTMLPEFSGRLFASSLEDFNFESHFFDAITLWDVVEHLHNPLDTLKALSGSLKPDGVMVISTPDIGSAVARLMGRRWAFMTPPEHRSFFNLRTIGGLAEKSGGKLTSHMARGKWTNLGFLFYKAHRVFPKAVPGAVVEALRKSPLARMPVYVPTHDILYVGIRY